MHNDTFCHMVRVRVRQHVRIRQTTIATTPRIQSRARARSSHLANAKMFACVCVRQHVGIGRLIKPRVYNMYVVYVYVYIYIYIYIYLENIGRFQTFSNKEQFFIVYIISIIRILYFL